MTNENPAAGENEIVAKLRADLVRVRRMRGLMEPAPPETKLKHTDRIAEDAIALAEFYAKHIETLNKLIAEHVDLWSDAKFVREFRAGLEKFRARAIEEKNLNQLDRVNAGKSITEEEKARVASVYKQVAPHTSTDSDLIATIAERLNMRERRVRTTLKHLGIVK